MRNLTIKTRLILTIGFLIVLLVALAGLGLGGMHSSNAHLESVYENRTVPIGDLAHINDLMRGQQQQLLLGAQHDPRLPESEFHENTHPVTMHTDAVRKNNEEIDAIWTSFKRLQHSAEEEKLEHDFEAARRDFVENGLNPALGYLEAGQFNKANMHNVLEIIPRFNKAKAIAEELLLLQVQGAEHEFTEADEAFSFISAITIGAIVVGVLVAGVIGFLLIRAITRPLNDAVQLTGQIAEGNLTGSVEVHSSDEIGRLMAALKQMHGKLREVVGAVSAATDTITSAAGEIAQGNMDLSQRTEEQASSLEETASSMEELTSTVKQNADNATQANQLAANARDRAEKGGEVVGNAVSAMENITASSKRIADIIGTVDAIAFQTNLLALNAAVEAARAGEQGRGFAVVAAEVRNLAQRSADSAKEISELINESVSTIGEGSRLVNESGDTLREIVDAVKKVSDIVSEIAAASAEQSAGIDQVNKAVMQMDEMTQQNAALVEEAASASKAMEDQAQDLAKVMSFFNTGAATDARAKTPDAPRKAAPSQKPATPKQPQQAAARPAPKPAKQAAARPAGEEEWEEF